MKDVPVLGDFIDFIGVDIFGRAVIDLQTARGRVLSGAVAMNADIDGVRKLPFQVHQAADFFAHAKAQVPTAAFLGAVPIAGVVRLDLVQIAHVRGQIKMIGESR